MQSLLNLVSILSSDSELDVHNTTILYSMNDNKYPSLETLEEAFNDESRVTFVDLFAVFDSNMHKGTIKRFLQKANKWL